MARGLAKGVAQRSSGGRARKGLAGTTTGGNSAGNGPLGSVARSARKTPGVNMRQQVAKTV